MGHLWILDGKWSLLSDFVPEPPREQSDIITPLTLSNGLETRLRCLVRFQLGLRRQEQEKKTASKDHRTIRVRWQTKRTKHSLDFPYDLLQLVVVSHLPLKDNIRASTVSKTWHEACLSVRIPDKPPWLIYFSKTEESSCELYDPSMQKRYYLSFPELSGSRVCHSNEGWLLVYNPNSFQLFFFSPFAHDRIPLPPLWMAYDQRMAFSCAPTSSTCLLFTVTNVTLDNITVKTCYPNAEEWNTFVFKNQLPVSTFEQIVFSNGVFYCLTNTGHLSIFDPSSSSWNVFLPGLPLRHHGSNGCFMAQHQGEIFLIYMYAHMNPTVLRLDHTNCEWTERKTLGGLTIYASGLCSETRAEQKQPRNCLCLPVFHGFKRTCIYYKVDEESVVSLKWKKSDPYANIWIMPPLNPILHQLL
ncbi:PREDICTED: LOW QUALITY PROTEIN: F-box protein At3g56470 [Brassica oleracea var. oleracea]|uniref:LOW QUALITY PROTEIN: F-box protein At3g56470 n=1 Tax=Brassica oleracea var. oleracea TaxID=109376 RepID=UPI0006A7054C|nr:PREDICTED: LOW QUALITY PROTEIN: F-box protein At3g56470 [Brassica oleracea var. oleracea]